MTGAGGKLQWREFAQAVAGAANVPAEAITAESRLLDDLGLDSLALSEVVVMLLVDLGMASLESGLGQRDWRHVTVGELFEEYRQGRPGAPREQFVIRQRQP